MLTHKNYTATVASLCHHMQLLNIGPSDRIFSYLPLAHTFEQVGAFGIMIAFRYQLALDTRFNQA